MMEMVAFYRMDILIGLWNNYKEFGIICVNCPVTIGRKIENRSEAIQTEILFMWYKTIH